MKLPSLKPKKFFGSSKKGREVSRSDTLSFGSNSSSEGSTPKSVLSDAALKITRRELESVLRRIGPDPPSDEEVAAMLAEAERGSGSGSGRISLAALAALGGGGGGAPELRDTFAIFDADGDGRISAEELMGVFVAIGDDGLSIDDCRRMIGEVDTDGDGFVCFDDFARMMDAQR